MPNLHEHFGQIDILINNAGSNKVGPVDKVSDQEQRSLKKLGMRWKVR